MSAGDVILEILRKCAPYGKSLKEIQELLPDLPPYKYQGKELPEKETVVHALSKLKKNGKVKKTAGYWYYAPLQK